MKKPSTLKSRSLRSLRTEVSAAPVMAKRNGLALGISTAMLMPLAAMAQSSATNLPETGSLAEVKIKAKAIDPNPNAEVGVPYKAKTSGDSRHTRPLAETPQTISVLTKAAIEDSGMTDLKQILGSQPGITLGTGENGNAFGDRYIIRGQEARSDVFVDGLRDPGMTTRESFAIEQLEISKGANSSFAGRGTAGGAINAITKQATLDLDFNRLSAAFGTDKHARLTADINKGFSDQFALRANVLVGQEDVPDRAPSNRSRKGLALSGLYEFNRDLSLTVDYYGLRAEDKFPDLGSYLVGTVPNRVPAKNVPVYAQANDFLKSDVDTLTARIKYKIAPDTSINSLTRFGTSSNAYATTGASSATRYNGTTGASYVTTTIDNGHTGWQEVDYFAHQTNLRLDRAVFGKKNEFVLGIEFTDHKVVSGNYAVNNGGTFNCRSANPTAAQNPTPAIGPNNAYCFVNPDGTTATADLTTFTGRTYARQTQNQRWHVRTLALSAMDTIDLTDKFTAFGGLRADHFDFSIKRYNNTTGGALQSAAENSDTLINGHVGLSYKLNTQGIVYSSLSSAQDINGGEPDSGISPGYGGYVAAAGTNKPADPERSLNFEVGTKWNVMDDKLLLTAAAFQNTKSDVMEGADYTGPGTYNTGKNRVKGIEFGASGNLTSKLTVQAGAAFMKSEILKSSPLPVQNPGSLSPADLATAQTNALLVAQANIGKRLANFANTTLSIQLKYQLTDNFAFGGAARHEGKRYGGQPDTAAAYATPPNGNGQYSQPVPSFTVYDLFGSYRVNKKLDVRMNVLNVTDKDYYTAVYRSGAFLYKGDGRAVRVTVGYEF